MYINRQILALCSNINSNVISIYHYSTIMLLTNIVLAGLSAVATAAPALVDRQVTTEVTPWEINAVNAGRPSGRPGPVSNNTLRIKLTNPNQVNLQRVPRGYTYFPSFVATCNWSWPSGGGPPYGIETVCTPTEPDSIYGNLTMKLSPGDGGAAQGDFNVDITEFRTVTVFQQEYIRVWEGAAKFKTGDNLQQICGGSGFCSWTLKKTPILVKQELTKSVGSCEESTTGGC
jgi:hypothetical protein